MPPGMSPLARSDVFAGLSVLSAPAVAEAKEQALTISLTSRKGGWPRWKGTLARLASFLIASGNITLVLNYEDAVLEAKKVEGRHGGFFLEHFNQGLTAAAIVHLIFAVNVHMCSLPDEGDQMGLFELQDRSRERRRDPRFVAHIEIDGEATPLSCMISDMSASGAKLTTGLTHNVPDEFTLLFRRRCRVVRRSEGQVGVEFA
jgi:hypothetical protein